LDLRYIPHAHKAPKLRVDQVIPGLSGVALDVNYSIGRTNQQGIAPSSVQFEALPDLGALTDVTFINDVSEPPLPASATAQVQESLPSALQPQVQESLPSALQPQAALPLININPQLPKNALSIAESDAISPPITKNVSTSIPTTGSTNPLLSENTATMNVPVVLEQQAPLQSESVSTSTTKINQELSKDTAKKPGKKKEDERCWKK